MPKQDEMIRIIERIEEFEQDEISEIKKYKMLLEEKEEKLRELKEQLIILKNEMNKGNGIYDETPNEKLEKIKELIKNISSDKLLNTIGKSIDMSVIGFE